MVHVERNPPESLRNGRSRGPSPNGHAGGSPDSSDDDCKSINNSSMFFFFTFALAAKSQTKSISSVFFKLCKFEFQLPKTIKEATNRQKRKVNTKVSQFRQIQ